MRICGNVIKMPKSNSWVRLNQLLIKFSHKNRMDLATLLNNSSSLQG